MQDAGPGYRPGQGALTFLFGAAAFEAAEAFEGPLQPLAVCTPGGRAVFADGALQGALQGGPARVTGGGGGAHADVRQHAPRLLTVQALLVGPERNVASTLGVDEDGELQVHLALGVCVHYLARNGGHCVGHARRIAWLGLGGCS